MREEEVVSDNMTMTAVKRAQSGPGKPQFPNMVWVPGGTFLMGSDKHYPKEVPAHEVAVDGFWMDRHTVTDEEFSNLPAIKIPRKVMEGGSHLCAPHYCRRYRPRRAWPSPSILQRVIWDFAASCSRPGKKADDFVSLLQ